MGFGVDLFAARWQLCSTRLGVHGELYIQRSKLAKVFHEAAL